MAELVEGALTRTGGPSPTSFAQATLEIVDRRTGLAVANMREYPDKTARLSRYIEDALDRLDVAAFCIEWGIEMPPTS